MNHFQMIAVMLLGGILNGCSSKIDAVNFQMADINNQAPLPVEAAPEFKAVPKFQYAAQPLRNPFLPNSIANELKMTSNKRAKPSVLRVKQPLEQFMLETLQMKGTLQIGSGRRVALIKMPDGHLEQVQLGDYLGLNQGKIIKISETQIDLVELISDGQSGYIARPRSLLLIQPVD